MKELIITEKDAGQRFDKFLKRYLVNASTSFIYKMLRKKNITLNGKKASGNEILKKDDRTSIFFSDETLEKFTQSITSLDVGKEYENAFSTLKDIQVLFENQHVIFLSKPAGILTQKALDTDISLNEWMIGYLLDKKEITPESLTHFKPSVLNRLDRNTSGLVLCGKTLLGSREISKLLKERALEKYYRLFVEGTPTKEGLYVAYLKKDKMTNAVTIVDTMPTDDYDMIKTSFTVKKSTKDYSYIEAELITGKTHQLRAHFAHMGYPIVGDPKYNRKEKQRQNEFQFLHAYRIVFPKMCEELSDISEKEFICPLPKRYEIFLDKYFNNQ